jgi:hypothetical protein
VKEGIKRNEKKVIEKSKKKQGNEKQRKNKENKIELVKNGN